MMRNLSHSPRPYQYHNSVFCVASPRTTSTRGKINGRSPKGVTEFAISRGRQHAIGMVATSYIGPRIEVLLPQMQPPRFILLSIIRI